MGYKVAAGLFRRGVLVAGTLTSAHTIRIEPPLIITYEQIDVVLEPALGYAGGSEQNALKIRRAGVPTPAFPRGKRHEHQPRK